MAELNDLCVFVFNVAPISGRVILSINRILWKEATLLIT